MANYRTSTVYGFHATDVDIAKKILNHEDTFQPSDGDAHWLGDGIYFWENNLERCKQYGVEDSKRAGSSIKTPLELGALLELGNCLDLLDQEYLDYLAVVYNQLIADLELEGKSLPQNHPIIDGDFDFKKRELDCAVIRYACELAEEQGEPFDSVRAVFWEGGELYPGAGFSKQNHIQIAIISPDCIKGIFIPHLPN